MDVQRTSVSQPKYQPAKPKDTSGSVEFFFGSDTHDGYPLLDKFISQANQKKPDFVLDGGDLGERGTPQEHQILESMLSKLQVPFASVPGNHDYKGTEIHRFENDFGTMPRSFDYNGVHFILLDDAHQRIGEDSFQFLENDLKSNGGKPTVVAMHVPPVWKATSPFIKALHGVMPETIASPKVEDPEQIKRFTDLMAKYHVGLVLAGHTHAPGDTTIEGVRYVTAGAVGGKLIKPGTGHEYLDVSIKDGKFDVRHVALDKPIDFGDVITKNVPYLFRMEDAIHDLKDTDDDDEVPPTATGAAADDDQGFFGELKEKVEEGIADGIELAAKVPLLKTLGYKLYGALSKPKDTSELHNVGELSPRLIRGAQPTEKGFETLKQQGVNTVINLRPEDPSEKAAVEKLGMRSVHLPLPAVGTPTNEQALQFLSIVTDPANGKSFFHCQRGIDRTGAMAAAYRIAVQGWSVEQAAAEMRQFGFKEGVEDDKLDFVRQFGDYWNKLPPETKAQVLHRSLDARA